jgi:hexulose-6-phosphate isomerase
MSTPDTNRRRFLSQASLSAAIVGMGAGGIRAGEKPAPLEKRATIAPPEGKRVLISCKLGMIAKKEGDRELTLTERLKMAGQAGFDGVDFDEAGRFSLDDARQAVQESGVFVHNAINHAHWEKRLTSPIAEDRAVACKNIAHCIRLSHAAGGNGVLIVIGKGEDGSAQEIDDRARAEIKTLIPLAASLGQPILFENVWNRMHYDHDALPEQLPNRFIDFVDSFQSPWVGMYYDLGNHWKYGQPRQWLKAFGRRAVKLDVKGFSRAKNKFVDITSEDDDLPWSEVQQGLREIEFTGWATAEVGGGNLERLTTVRKQMQKAFGIQG